MCRSDLGNRAGHTQTIRRGNHRSVVSRVVYGQSRTGRACERRAVGLPLVSQRRESDSYDRQCRTRGWQKFCSGGRLLRDLRRRKGIKSPNLNLGEAGGGSDRPN